MNRLGFPNDVIRIDGALDVVSTPLGVAPRRLPRWTGSRISDAFLAFDVEACAGVRLRFRTRSTSVSLTLRCNALQLDELEFAAAIDLLVDGEFVERREVTEVGRIRFAESRGASTTEGLVVTVNYEGLGDADKEIELWLPHTATCELIALETSQPVRATDARRTRWVHYGSSISHCLEAPGPTDTWPARVALARRLDLVDLGFAGQAVLDPFVARAIRDTQADVISLKLGINIVGGQLMRERTFRSAVDGFLDLIRQGHPTTPVLVVSAIHSPRYETCGLAGELSLARSRDILADVVEARIEEGEDTRYLDGQLLLGADEAEDLPDGLHPSPAAYLRMAGRFMELSGF